MLSFENVKFTYEGDLEPTIQDLSFSLQKGEFVSLLGSSGCGKSTIFRLVNGLLKPQSGSIFVDGDNIEGHTGYCGYMPQNDLLFPWRSVVENVELPMEIRKNCSKAERRERALQALERVGLKEYANKAPSELSGGMRQRAAFARTIMTENELLLLDEPFSALDYLTRLTMREWLLEQWEQERKTILFITHDVEEALFLSGRILVADKSPIQKLESFAVPMDYPRNRSLLEKPEVVALKETLIGMLA